MVICEWVGSGDSGDLEVGELRNAAMVMNAGFHHLLHGLRTHHTEDTPQGHRKPKRGTGFMSLILTFCSLVRT